MTVDDRWYMMQIVLISDIPSSVNYFYPRLIPLVNIDYYAEETPTPIRCTSCKLQNTEAYLLGEIFFSTRLKICIIIN